MTTHRALDPAVEELLHALAREPRTDTLLLDPQRIVRGIADGSVVARATRTGASSTERELMSVLREDVVQLLDATYVDALRASTASLVFTPTTNRNLQNWRRDLRDWLEGAESPSHGADLRAALVDADPVRVRGDASARRALASMIARLSSAPRSRLLFAAEHLQHRDWATAAHLAIAVSESAARADERKAALDILGSAWLSLGDANSAIDSFERALRLAVDDGLPPAAVCISATNVIVTSVFRDDADRIVTAANTIDLLPRLARAEALEHHVRQIRTQRQREFSLDDRGRGFVRRMRDRCPDAVQELFDAML
ncbi:MAG: hypothetical protein L6Q99_17200 [Planctomycetes bacterium]|nr:hypothetical protein [Planctomycetota bacterium]